MEYRRAITFMVDGRQRRDVVRVPSSHFYVKEIQRCQDMYARLQLDKHTSQDVSDTSFPFLKERSSLVGRPRPLTYTKGQSVQTSKVRPFSIRSAPAFVLKERAKTTLNADNVGETDVEKSKEKDDKSDKSSITCDYDDHGQGRKRTRMDPAKLCDYLKDHGFGQPLVSKNSQKYRRVSQVLPRGFKSRPLPKDPSQREKIKGRARLDQEMANMRALAFCEQQAPKAFRTASANMNHRDVQFLEEDMREHLHREDLDDDDDDNASIVMMPMSQEEMFVRIGNWIDDVESACVTRQTS